jgi:hypothetical protein
LRVAGEDGSDIEVTSRTPAVALVKIGGETNEGSATEFPVLGTGSDTGVQVTPASWVTEIRSFELASFWAVANPVVALTKLIPVVWPITGVDAMFVQVTPPSVVRHTIIGICPVALPSGVAASHPWVASTNVSCMTAPVATVLDDQWAPASVVCHKVVELPPA